jgi:hypothetical protein
MPQRKNRMCDSDIFIEPTFKVGDKVIFEVSENDPTLPRYIFNDDLGPSGKWLNGEVMYADKKLIQVEYTPSGEFVSMRCNWPNYDHPDYDSFQWWQDGYLEPVKVDRDVLVCECGADTIGTSHSSWCPKYIKD